MNRTAALVALASLFSALSAQAQPAFDTSAAWFKPQLTVNREAELCSGIFKAYSSYFATTAAKDPLTPISTRGDSEDASASPAEGVRPVEWLAIGERLQRLTHWRQRGKYFGIVERGQAIGWRAPFYTYHLIDTQLSRKERTEGVGEGHGYGALSAVRPAGDAGTLDVVYGSTSGSISVSIVNVYTFRERTYLVLVSGPGEKVAADHYVVSIESPHKLSVACRFTSHPSVGALAAQAAAVPRFRDFQRVVGDIMGESGACGTSNAYAYAVLKMREGFDMLLVRPWARGFGGGYDFSTWGHSGAWNYRKYMEYSALLPEVQRNLGSFYARQYRLPVAAAKTLAEDAIRATLAEAFNHRGYDDPHFELHQALLEGAPIEKLSFLLDGFDEKDERDSLISFAIGHPALVEHLLKRGLDPNKVNAFGKTPLMYAAQFNDLASARLLVRHGANTNLATTRPMDSCGYTMQSTGVTALHYAVRYASAEFVGWLVEAGAATTAKDTAGQTPRDYLGHYGGRDAQQVESLARVLTPLGAEASRTAADQENRRAESLYKSGDVQGAYRAVKRALAFDPSNERALANISLLALRIGQEGESAKAATALIKAAKSGNELAAAYFNLALACEAAAKKFHYANIYYDGQTYCSESWDRHEGPLFYYLKAYQAAPSAARSRAIATFFQQTDSPRGKWLCRDPDSSATLKAVYVSRGHVYFLTSPGAVLNFSPLLYVRDRRDMAVEVKAKETFAIGDGLAVTHWQGDVPQQGTLVLGNRLCSRPLPSLIEDGLRLVEVHTIDKPVEVLSLTATPVVLVLYGDKAAWKLAGNSRNVRGIYVHGKDATLSRPAALDVASHADDRRAYPDPSDSSFNQYTRIYIGLPIHAIVDASGRAQITIDDALLAGLPACTAGPRAIRTNCRPQ